MIGLQLQELARDQVLQTFCSALRHMDQNTLITRVMSQLQLPTGPVTPQQAASAHLLSPNSLRVTLSQPAAQQPQTTTLEQFGSRKSSLLDPISIPHPKKRRSERPTRPASAGVPGMHTRFSICARQSGYPAESSDGEEEEEREQRDTLMELQDWGRQFPASTSALLQAVEMAAAAERPGSTCPVTGKRMCPIQLCVLKQPLFFSYLY